MKKKKCDEKWTIVHKFLTLSGMGLIDGKQQYAFRRYCVVHDKLHHQCQYCNGCDHDGNEKGIG